MPIFAIGWDVDGDGLVALWESTGGIIFFIAAALTALFVIGKYGAKMIKALYGFIKKLVRVVIMANDMLDDIRGVDGEPGFKEAIRLQNAEVRRQGERQEEIAEIAKGVARQQLATSKEVSRRFDGIDGRLDKGERSFVDIRGTLGVLDRRTLGMAKKIDYELSANDGGSVKDHTTLTQQDTGKIKQALIDNGTMSAESEGDPNEAS